MSPSLLFSLKRFVYVLAYAVGAMPSAPTARDGRAWAARRVDAPPRRWEKILEGRTRTAGSTYSLIILVYAIIHNISAQNGWDIAACALNEVCFDSGTVVSNPAYINRPTLFPASWETISRCHWFEGFEN